MTTLTVRHTADDNARHQTTYYGSEGFNPWIPCRWWKIRVLYGIDLTIYEGEMVAIIGQSGSGKSTLMNILGCLDQATAGSYHIYGKAVDKLTADELAELRREHFGLFFSAIILLGDINAQDNVAVPACMQGCRCGNVKRAPPIVRRLRACGKTQNRPSQLSGGQQQRVSIARALMNGGDIILGWTDWGIR